jgi:hypothetical protein
VTDLPEITDVRRLAIRPGDRLVITSPEWLSRQDIAETSARVRAALQLPDDVPVVVLGSGMTLEVVHDG